MAAIPAVATLVENENETETHDDATALMRYLQKQGKLSKEKSEAGSNSTTKTKKTAAPSQNNNDDEKLNGGAAEQEEPITPKQIVNKVTGKSAEAQKNKSKEEEERESLMKYMSQRGVVLKPPVAHAVAVPVGDSQPESSAVIEGRYQLGGGVVQNISTAELLREVRRLHQVQ